MSSFHSYTLHIIYLLVVRLYFVYNAEQCEIVAGQEECTTIDLCESMTCQNGGNCSSDTCQCESGFTGSLCETDIDECSSSPCGNDGQCIDIVDGFTCTCSTGYTGTTCETDIDYCADSPCQNGGTCNDQIESYYCTCPSRYSGQNCSLYYECALTTDICENGGTCETSSSGSSCSCVSGYTGSHCETNIDECVEDACLHGGLCTDGINSYNCTCVAGFLGDTCNETCSFGFYGENCTSVCTCVTNNTESCNVSTGDCVCRPGFYPGNCSQACSNMTYGRDCGFDCTCNAENTESCDPTTGDCSCIDGWTSENCTSMVVAEDTSASVDTTSLGLVVGLPVAVVILMLLLGITICFVCRVVKRKRNKPESLPPIEYVDSKAGETNGNSAKNRTLPKEQTYINNEIVSQPGINTSIGKSSKKYSHNSIQGSSSSSRKMPLPEVPAYVNTTMKLEVETKNPAYEDHRAEMTYENIGDEPENDYDLIPVDDHLIDTPAYTDLIDPSTYYI